MPEINENQIKRIMPHDSAMERALLGTLLVYPEVIRDVRENVAEEDFYDRQSGLTFRAICEMSDANQPIDPLTLRSKLGEMDVPPEMTTLEFVSSISNSAGIRDLAEGYAQKIAESALKRSMIRLNEELAGNCYSGKNIDEVFEEAEKKLFKLIQSRSTSETVPIKDVVFEALAQIEKAARNKGGIIGIPTGFTDLDRLTMGLQPANLVLVAARPSMGKTALVLNMAENMICRQGRSVAIFSLEMPKADLVKRLLAINSKVNARNIWSGSLSDGEWHEVIQSAGTIAGSKLVIDDTTGISLGELRSKARKYKLENEIDVIMIDYLQLMSVSKGSKADSRQQEISEISRGLKEIARELDVPVIALSQLSRQVESRSDHRPMLSDLRESGAIEQDADMVMFIYRDDYYHEDSDKKGISEISVQKNRNGEIGKVELVWIPELTKFANMDHSTISSLDE